MEKKYYNGICVDEHELRKKSEPVMELNKDVLKCIGELKKQMDKRPGCQGLAAIQVGYPYRIAITRMDEVIRIMINLELTKKSWFQFSNEGCESLKGDRYGLWRPRTGECRYLNEQMQEEVLWLSKRYVRVVAHEVDHFNGVLIKDKGRKFIYDSNNRGHYLPKRGLL